MKKPDQIETIDGALFQHGKANDRLYLMKGEDQDPEELLQTIHQLLTTHEYTKAFIKVTEKQGPFFVQHGFVEEARIPGYYGSEDCLFMGRFFDPRRATLGSVTQEQIANILMEAEEKQESETSDENSSTALSKEFTMRPLTEKDCGSLAALYKEVFKTYPFPIHDEEYLRTTMRDSLYYYFGIFSKENLIAVAAAEVDKKRSAAELTDFAVAKEYRGNAFASLLLAQMEKILQKAQIKTLYTIARAISPGMNHTFSNAGYKYTGTLVNNTNISGAIESMNVWYKPTSD